MEIELKDIKKIVENANNILLVGHVNSDGDALGSTLAFKRMIKKMYPNKEARVIFEDKVPKYIYKFIDKNEILSSISNEELKKVDLIITLDTANKERVALNNIDNKDILNIDHHISNTRYGKYNYVEEISSASEIVAKIGYEWGMKLDKEIAELIYLGIINDTGNFRHTNVTKNTFNIAADLMEYGLDNNKIYRTLFSRTLIKTKLFGKAFHEANINNEKKFVYFYLSQEDMKKLNASKDDTDGIVEILLDIDECSVSLFIREDEDGSIKGSLRSKYDQNVNYIASLFGGGGHIKAAGFKTNKNKEEIINIIINNLD